MQAGDVTSVTEPPETVAPASNPEETRALAERGWRRDVRVWAIGTAACLCGFVCCALLPLAGSVLGEVASPWFMLFWLPFAVFVVVGSCATFGMMFGGVVLSAYGLCLLAHDWLSAQVAPQQARWTDALE